MVGGKEAQKRHAAHGGKEGGKQGGQEDIGGRRRTRREAQGNDGGGEKLQARRVQDEEHVRGVAVARLLKGGGRLDAEGRGRTRESQEVRRKILRGEQEGLPVVGAEQAVDGGIYEAGKSPREAASLQNLEKTQPHAVGGKER